MKIYQLITAPNEREASEGAEALDASTGLLGTVTKHTHLPIVGYALIKDGILSRKKIVPVVVNAKVYRTLEY
jgi:hypothetical protein